MGTALDVMVLSSDVESRRQLKTILDQNGIESICSSSVRDCCQVLSERSVDLVFCASRLADGSYRDLLRTEGVANGTVKVVITSRLTGWEEFLEAMRLGAFDMIVTPCLPTEVEWVLSQVARARRNERQAARLDTRTREIHLHP